MRSTDFTFLGETLMFRMHFAIFLRMTIQIEALVMSSRMGAPHEVAVHTPVTILDYSFPTSRGRRTPWLPLRTYLQRN
jgi:hypothetical protein